MLPALRPHPVGAPGPWCCSRDARRAVHPGLGGGAEWAGRAGKAGVGANRGEGGKGGPEAWGAEEWVRGRQGREGGLEGRGPRGRVGRGSLGGWGAKRGWSCGGFAGARGGCWGWRDRRRRGRKGGSRVWGLGGEGRAIRAQGPGGSPGLGSVRMRAVSGRSPHIEEEAAPTPPSLPHLLSTSAAVCEGGAKSRTGFPSQTPGWIPRNWDSPPPHSSPLPSTAPKGADGWGRHEGLGEMSLAANSQSGAKTEPILGKLVQKGGRTPKCCSQDPLSPPGTGACSFPLTQRPRPPAPPLGQHINEATFWTQLSQSELEKCSLGTGINRELSRMGRRGGGCLLQGGTWGLGTAQAEM